MHPDDRKILLYLEDKLPSKERGNIEAHVARCAACANRLANLSRLSLILEQPVPIDLDVATREKARKLVGQREDGWWKGFKPFNPPYRFALAGAAVIALVLSIYLLGPQGEPRQFRSERSEEVETFELYPEDAAIVSDRGAQFRWTSVGESMVYRFSLLEETGVIIWSNDIRDTVIAIPLSVVLRPGKTYLWRVETFLADKTLEHSALHAFTYSPH